MSDYSFLLFATSGTAVELVPEFSYQEDDEVIASRHRSQSGKQYVYKWGDVRGWKLPVTFLTTSEAGLLNQWWKNNTSLTLINETTSDEYSVRIMNGKKPIAQFIKPYTDLLKGTVELETY